MIEEKPSLSERLKPLWTGAVLVAIVVLAAIYVNTRTGQQPNEGKSLLGYNVSRAGSRAFGNLQNVLLSQQAQSPERSQSGGGRAETADEQSSPGFGGGGVPSSASPLFPPEVVSYRYVYGGEEFSVDESRMDVYKRLKGVLSDEGLGRQVASLNLGTINLNSFPGSRLRNVSIADNREDGYQVYIDFFEGVVSVSRKYPTGRTEQGAQRLELADVPDDSELIAVADRFVNAHGIDLSRYGQPEVKKEWLVAYEATSNKSEFYIPNFHQVVYPLMIEGQTVYDLGGGKNGIVVNVSVPDMEVEGVWEIYSLNFQASAYETETDVQKILQIAERGGIYGRQNPRAVREVDIALGTPELSLVKLWNWNQGENTELFVPALIFPITNVPAGETVWQQNIAVPIIKGLPTEPGVIPLGEIEKAE